MKFNWKEWATTGVIAIVAIIVLRKVQGKYGIPVLI